NSDDRPLAEFSMPALIASQPSEADNSTEALFRARPFVFARLYRDYGQDKRTKAMNIARLALSYWEGGAGQASPSLAQDLLNRAGGFGGRLALEAARAFTGLSSEKLLARAKAASQENQAVLPDEALILSRWLVSQAQLETAKGYLNAALRDKP